MKLEVGHICKSLNGDIYLVLKTNRHGPVSLVCIDTTDKYNKVFIGRTYSQNPNQWQLTKVADGKISKLEAVIYGVTVENT